MKRVILLITLSIAVVTFGKTKIIAAFDTEDYTNDKSNDAILEIANILTQEGVVGHFNMVGFLCQRLVEFRRMDVLDALKPHAIGSQSKFHSLHPNLCEVSDIEDYAQAYRNVGAMESEGFGMIKAAMGVDDILFMDPPGNSWSYVSLYFYVDNGVKFYLGGGFTDHPRGKGGAYGDGGIVRRDNLGEGLWYCNMYQVPYSHIFGFESLLRDNPPDIDAVLNTMAKRDMVTIYMHPHMAILKHHPDGANWLGKNKTPFRQWIVPEARPEHETQRFYKRFREFIHKVKSDERFEFVDLRQYVKTLKPRVAIRRVDIPSIRASLERKLEHISNPASYSVADCFQAAVMMLRGEEEYLPSKAYGFLYPPKGVEVATEVNAADLCVAAKTIDISTFLPPQIRVGDKLIGPADFLYAALEVLATGAEKVTLNPRDQLGSFDEVPTIETVRIKGGWKPHADTFEDKWLSMRLKLQLWTTRIE